MPTTYTNGLKLPDLGSIDWFNAYKNNIDILDPIVGTVNGVATTYAPISHNHDASEITSGTIDIARLPPAALERLHTVADQTARYALTTSTVQEGDTVKQLDTGVMYLVVDVTKLNSADGYTEYSAGTATKAIADEDGNSIKSSYGKLAGNNTWTGTNLFSDTVSIKGNTIFERLRPQITTGTIPSSDVLYGVTRYKESGRYSLIIQRGVVSSVGENRYDEILYNFKDVTINCRTTLGINYNGSYSYYSVDVTDLIPSSTNSVNLGTSTNKWKTINGYEPSALGEVYVGNEVTIDTTDWVLDGSDWNSLNTSIMSGWVYLAVSGCDADSFILLRRGTNKAKNPTICFHPQHANSGTYYLYALFMVPKNTTCIVAIKAGTNGVLSQKLLYPCFGNV